MKRIFFSLIACFACLAGMAQVKALRINDTLPDLQFYNVSNYSSPLLNLRELKGKGVIFDFWSPSCISCIQAFPKMEALQKQLNDSVYIILVNAQSRDSTNKFFALRKKLKKPDLILLSGDTVLYKLFPHVGEPYHVWISKEGRVKHLADGYNATAENLRRFIAGNELDFKSYIPRQNYVKSLFPKEWQDSLKYYSYISKAIRGISTGSGLQDENTYLQTNNGSVVELYIQAFNEGERYNFLRPGRLILQFRDSFSYMRPKDGNLYQKWLSEFSYTYNLKLPPGRLHEKYRIMQEDLKRYFDLKASVIKKEIQCWVLIRTSSKDKLKSRHKSVIDNFRADNERTPIFDSIRYFYGHPYRNFSSRMETLVEYYLKVPFLDSTGINELIDIEMKGDTIDNMNLIDLKKELNRYDLDLVERPVLVDVLEIKQKGPTW